MAWILQREPYICQMTFVTFWAICQETQDFGKCLLDKSDETSYKLELRNRRKHHEPNFVCQGYDVYLYWVGRLHTWDNTLPHGQIET